jgi:hypothetical protein
VTATREGIEDIVGEPGEVTDTGRSRLAVAEPGLEQPNHTALAYRKREAGVGAMGGRRRLGRVSRT